MTLSVEQLSLLKNANRYLKNSVFTKKLAHLKDENSVFRNSNLAKVLKEIEDNTTKDFYDGELGKKLFQFFSSNGTDLVSDDLKYYRPRFFDSQTWLVRDLKFHLPRHPSIAAKSLVSLFSQFSKLLVQSHNIVPPALIESIAMDVFGKSKTMKLFPKKQMEAVTTIVVKDHQGNVAILQLSLNELFGSGSYSEDFGGFSNSAMKWPTFGKAGLANFQSQWDLAKRPMTEMNFGMMERGFDDVIFFAAQPGFVEQGLFQILYAYIGANKGFSAAFKGSRFYSFPREGVNLAEKGLPKKMMNSSLKQKVTVMSGKIGGMIVLRKDKKGRWFLHHEKSKDHLKQIK